VGEAADQAGKGAGLKMQEVHQVVGFGRRWQQHQGRQNQQQGTKATPL
jgi:hypothetical protein